MPSCLSARAAFEQNEQGITIFGRLCPGTFTLPGNVSSQFISGLLFATPLMEAPKHH